MVGMHMKHYACEQWPAPPMRAIFLSRKENGKFTLKRAGFLCPFCLAFVKTAEISGENMRGRCPRCGSKAPNVYLAANLHSVGAVCPTCGGFYPHQLGQKLLEMEREKIRSRIYRRRQTISRWRTPIRADGVLTGVKQ